MVMQFISDFTGKLTTACDQLDMVNEGEGVQDDSHVSRLGNWWTLVPLPERKKTRGRTDVRKDSKPCVGHAEFKEHMGQPGDI